jgi:hypothetical protein
MSGKAAKLLGVTPAKLSRSKSERKSKSRGKSDLSTLVKCSTDNENKVMTTTMIS